MSLGVYFLMALPFLLGILILFLGLQVEIRIANPKHRKHEEEE